MALRHSKLTGEEVGRLVIRDLAAIHINTGPRKTGEEPMPVMTAAEKAEMVNSLTEPAEVAAYNGYRYFHEFLARAALYFNIHQQNSESRFWQISARLQALRMAEMENRHLLLEMPKIVTKAEFNHGRSLFNPAGDQKYGRGTAILEVSLYPTGTFSLTRDGRFQPPVPDCRISHMAENFLKMESDFVSLMTSYRASLKEALVIVAAMDVFAKFLNVPELEAMVPDLDLRQMDLLNKEMALIPHLIIRRGLMADERPEEELKAALTELFRPVDSRHLRPSARLKAKAVRAMDFSVAQGNSEKIYEILRQEPES